MAAGLTSSRWTELVLCINTCGDIAVQSLLLIAFRWFWGVVNQPNLSVEMMRHDYDGLTETGQMIGT